MTRRLLLGSLMLAAVAAVAVERHMAAQNLTVTFGPQGVQRLQFGSTVLEDLQASPADVFHIWHMKVTDLAGDVLTQDGWGENNEGRQWDAASRSWTTNYAWGSIRVGFAVQGNTLNMNVTATNRTGSGVIFDGAAIYPMALHMPSLPVGFADPSYPQLAFNTTGPSVTVADWGAGEVVAVAPDAAKPLYSGFQPTGQGTTYTPIISGTALDGMATFLPHNDRPVMPGQTDSYTVSLRFAPSGTPAATLATDADASWATTWPAQLHWTDRRIIGTVYLASSPTGSNVNQPGGYPNNPRRYFNDGTATDFDVRTAAGLAQFQRRVLTAATNNVANLRRLNAQGAITWDIEGEQYPQDTSYVCSPDQIATVAPEMESVITDQTSPYAGMKLDDAYFKTMRDAGFRVGVCVRPQNFAMSADGTAQQTTLPDAQVAAELLRKAKYAHDRWGATLFYMDSTVETDGAVLDASIFQQVAAALPDSLLIPEESTPKHYAYTAPFKTFLFHGDLGTDASVYAYYPHAFSANLINDVDPGKLAAATPALTASVKAGDVLMVHADYWQANNDTVVAIYQAAGGGGTANPPAPAPSPTPTPVPTSPVTTPTPTPTPTPAPAPKPPVVTPPSSGLVITSPPANSTIHGATTVQAQVNVGLDAGGSYLMVDGTEIGTRHVAEGPFQYPLNTATLANGTHLLQLWGHTTANTVVLSATVPVVVSNTTTTPPSPAPGTPTPVSSSPAVLTFPLNGQGISGVVDVTARIAATLDAAGSYLMVDGSGVGWPHAGNAPYVYALDTSLLSAGTHVLQVWAHDIGNSVLLSNTVTVVVH